MIMSTGRWWHPGEGIRLSLLDISRGLQEKQRFGGMLPLKWNVLHHTIALYQALREIYPEGGPEFWLKVLFHDAHEFIMGDMPAPIKTLGRRVEEHDMQRSIEFDTNIRRFTQWVGTDETHIIKAIDRLETEHEGWSFFSANAPTTLREKNFRPATGGGSIDRAVDDVFANYPDTHYANSALMWRWIDLVMTQIRLLDSDNGPLVS